MMKKLKLGLLFLFALISFTSCQDEKKNEQEKERTERMEAQRKAEMQAEQKRMELEQNSIMAKVISIDSLSSFGDALKRTSLSKILKEDEGPFTVFAPINEAFNKLNAEGQDSLTANDNKNTLEEMLKYHVVKNKITSEVLTKMIEDNEGEYKLDALNGGELIATEEEGNMVLKDQKGNTLTILKPDIEASNGVIYVINEVGRAN